TAGFGITRAALSITTDAVTSTATIDHFTKVYGSANPVFIARYSGLVAGDTPASLGGSLAFSTTATTTSGVGAYTVSPSGVTSGNYTISFVDGTLDVARAALEITANDRTKTYGDTLVLGTSAFSTS